MKKVIYFKRKAYYKYDVYDTYQEAYNDAKYYKMKNKSRYFILKIEKGWYAPYEQYILYLDKVKNIW